MSKNNTKKATTVKASEFDKESVKFWKLNVDENDYNKFNYRARIEGPLQIQIDRFTSRFGGLPSKEYLDESKGGSDAGRISINLDEQKSMAELKKALEGIDERVQEELPRLLEPLAKLLVEKKKKGKGKPVTEEDVEKMVKSLIESSVHSKCVKEPKKDDDEEEETRPSKCTLKFPLERETGVISSIITIKNEDGTTERLNNVKPMDLYEHIGFNVRLKIVVEAQNFWILKAVEGRKYGVKLVVKRIEITKGANSGGGSNAPAEFLPSDDEGESTPPPKKESPKPKEQPKEQPKKTPDDDSSSESEEEKPKKEPPKKLVKEPAKKPAKDDDSSDSE